MAPTTPVRPITADEIETFWRDGVVCLRGVLPIALLQSMHEPVAELLQLPEMANMSAMGDALAAGGQVVLRNEVESPRRGRFISGVDHWRQHNAFRSFSCDSALGAIAGALLRATKVNLWEDSVLVKEPGTQERTAWHQDMAYFHVKGEQVCTIWCPLDTVTTATGAVQFVAGSHRRRDVYRPNLFVSTMAIPGTEGDEVPDIDQLTAKGDARIVTFDTEPGDLTVHHARTIHGAGPNTSGTAWRRAISVRYCGDDARYFRRAGAPMKSHHHHVHDGDLLDGPDCPVVWRST
jgi:ectoine hydroxylase-related dioxygenase (phytanoyl-CoA dioxygenase family)